MLVAVGFVPSGSAEGCGTASGALRLHAVVFSRFNCRCCSNDAGPASDPSIAVIEGADGACWIDDDCAAAGPRDIAIAIVASKAVVTDADVIRWRIVLTRHRFTSRLPVTPPHANSKRRCRRPFSLLISQCQVRDPSRRQRCPG